MFRIVLVICALSFFIEGHAQVNKNLSVKDSLELVLKTAQDTNRIIVLNKLSFQYLRIASYEKALSYSSEARVLSEQLKYQKGQAKSLINTGNVFLAQSEFEK